MDGYSQISLRDVLKSIGEDEAKALLSSFLCPKNPDVERFIRDKAITFADQNIAQTFLVFCSYKNKPELIAYYTITTKVIIVPKSKIGSNLSKRIKKFGEYDNDNKGYEIPAILLAQLGKNFDRNLNELITGDELLKMAIDRVISIQELAGGKVVYVECEDKPVTMNLYTRNGFCPFGKRQLDKDEKDSMSSNTLIQLLKYVEHASILRKV